MNAAQIILGLITLGAFTYTVLAYPNKYGAISARSRLFRTVNAVLIDLLLVLVLMATFIDWKAGVASEKVGLVRGIFYLSSCLFLVFALTCVALLDALESYSTVRRERRAELEQALREQVEKARAEAAATAAKTPTTPGDANTPSTDDPVGKS